MDTNNNKKTKPTSEDPVKEALSHPNGPSLEEMLNGQEEKKPRPRSGSKDIPDPQIPIIWVGRVAWIKTKRLKRITFQPFIFILQPLLAVLFKRIDQIIGDHLRRAAFDLVALDHVNQLTILK